MRQGGASASRGLALPQIVEIAREAGADRTETAVVTAWHRCGTADLGGGFATLGDRVSAPLDRLSNPGE